MSNATKTLDLIAQMLKKAESTTPAEAEMIMARAEKLMIRHGIDQAMLESTGKKPTEEMVVRYVTFRGVYAHAELHLAWSVVHGLKLQGVQNKSRHYGRIHVIGYRSDADRAVELINSLVTQSARAARAWWNNDAPWYLKEQTEHRKFVELRTFRIGFANRAGERIAALRTSTASEMDAATPGTALVLQSREQAAEAERCRLYPGLKTERRSMSAYGSVESGQSGRAAANRADVGANRVSGTAATKAVSR